MRVKAPPGVVPEGRGRFQEGFRVWGSIYRTRGVHLPRWGVRILQTKKANIINFRPLERQALRASREDFPIASGQLVSAVERSSESSAVLDVLDCYRDMNFDCVLNRSFNRASYGQQVLVKPRCCHHGPKSVHYRNRPLLFPSRLAHAVVAHT